MTPPAIRPLAICVFHRNGRILVSEAAETDPAKPPSFCRPLGGGIEFGEPSAQALAREIREELGVEICNLTLLGTLENIFNYLGAPGHEIVQVYDAHFCDPSLYEKPFLPGLESNDIPFQAHWRPRSYFSAARPLYPDGLIKLLEQRRLFKDPLR